MFNVSSLRHLSHALHGTGISNTGTDTITPMLPNRTYMRRGLVVTAAAAVGLLAAAGASSAHVRVHPDSYARGATDGVLTFRVPNEMDDARTTKVQVFLPTDDPVLGVLVRPQDGWTPTVTHTKLKTPIKTDDGVITDAVSEISWTGGTIGPGRYEDFDVAFGQLPDHTGRLTFKALQTYSDGMITRWIEEAQSGQEPENPAPVLRLTATAGEGQGSARTVPVAGSKTSSSAKQTASADDSTARTLGISGLVVGGLGLAAAAAAVMRARAAAVRPE